MTTLINAISPRQLAEILQQAGYRAAEVQHGNSVQIQSAAQGLNFAIAFGNAAPGVEGGFSDFSFSCPLQIQGDLDPQLLIIPDPTSPTGYRKSLLVGTTVYGPGIGGSVAPAPVLRSEGSWREKTRNPSN